MAKFTKASVFKMQAPKTETKLDKTTRIVRMVIDEEAKLRHTKIERLRIARLGREANTPGKPSR